MEYLWDALPARWRAISYSYAQTLAKAQATVRQCLGSLLAPVQRSTRLGPPKRARIHGALAT